MPVQSTLSSASSSHALSREPKLLLNDIRHQLRSRSSEPNLLSRYDYGYRALGSVNNQTIVISNHNGNKTNQIILKSSFSDQNLTTNINADSKNFNCSVQYSDDPLILPLEVKPPQLYADARENSIISSSSSSSRGLRRRLPLPPRNTQSLYIPTFETIPSIESDFGSFCTSPLSPRFSKSLSADASSDQDVINEDICSLKESYLKSEDETASSLRRSYSLIADDQIIDVEYDSDTGWMTKNVRKNPLKKVEKSKELERPQRERSYSRENLKLDLKMANKPTTPTIVHKSNPKENKNNDVDDKEIAKDEKHEDDHTKLDDSIGSIINNVRSQLLLSQSDAVNDDDVFDVQEERRSSLKVELEGKVVTPKIAKTSGSTKYVCEKAIGFENENPFSVEDKKSDEQPNVFQKCRSRSSQGTTDSNGDDVDNDGDDDDDAVDEVFETPFNRDKNASFHGKSRKNISSFRRSSSLENIPKKSIVRNSSTGSKSTRNSSVSINENPEYFEYSIPSKTTKSCKIASSNAIAKLRTKPTRGSLKKSTSSIKSKKPSTTLSRHNSSSDYDRRMRNTDGGHRESFKKHDRTNGRNSEQDRDASDREQKDGNLNRSLSNTDTNIEDRIGEYVI